MAKWFYWEENTLYLHIHLQPRASRQKIVGPFSDYLKISITAPPLDNRANQQLLKLLADTFNVPLKQITLLKGEHSRIKLIRIDSPKQLDILNENYFCQ